MAFQAERPSRADYQRKRREQAVTLYFRNREQRAALQARAAKEGYAGDFNGWLLQQIANATSGAIFPPEYVEALRKDLEKARRELDSAREERGEYRTEAKTLQAQRDAALAVIAALEDGDKIVARLLNQGAKPVLGVRA